jgi:hypothetical protein
VAAPALWLLSAALALSIDVPGHAGSDARVDAPEPTVGMAAWIRDLVLPGSELEARPAEDDAPLVLRVAAVYRHGDAHRYDLVFYGLEPGAYDLRDWLRRRDGTSADDLPPIPVSVRSVLAPGQVEPHRLAVGDPPALGGYRRALIAAGVAWTAGLVLILAWGRRRRRAAAPGARAATLAEVLRPLVERALEGTLSGRERARLELALIAFWRRRLGLEGLAPHQALAALREHAEAGALLRALEDWLHRPEPRAAVDVAALLAPYRELGADEIEVAPQGAA